MPTHRILALLLVGFAILSTVVSLLQPTTTPEVTPGIPVLGRGPRLLVVSLEGAIRSGDPALSGAGVVRRRLSAAAKNPDVKGVLLTINSPGGTVAASQEVYRAIQSLHRAGKPVVVSMGDVAASGGYYAASGADVIYANPGTLTGSIGVIISGFNGEELLKNLGIQSQTIKTGPFKDILSFTRPLTPAERELLQGLVDDSLDQFIRDIVQGRQQQPVGDFRAVLSETTLQQRQALSYERVKALADGRILTGRQAQGVGLVDVLGGYEAALQGLRLLVGDEEEKLPVSGDQPGLNRLLDWLQVGGAESAAWVRWLFSNPT
ncbi:MAG: signal peptide peptidase SppA [Thermostichales cyanobacterium DRC_bins_46]